MNIKTIGTYVLGGMMATSVTGCKQSFKEAKNVEPFVQECVDTISSYTKTVLEDPAYKFFGKDTLALGKDFAKNPETFLKTMSDSAEAKVPTRLMDSKFVLVKTPFGHEPKTVEIRKPVYEETRAVITSPKIFEKGGEQYVPVEYYGK